MNRQVDIKALVSHVVRGDGLNKCRICMGDTSEGQVFLSDTVLMEGEHKITLSELLEIISGVEVPRSEDLPVGLCTACSNSALNAAQFRILCRQATFKWDSMIKLLDNIPLDVHKFKTMFLIIEENQMTIINDGDGLITQSTNINLPEQKPSNEANAKPEMLEGYKKHKCQCPDCGKKFINAPQLYQHLKESTDLKRACYICAQIMTRDELVTHLSSVHKCKPYACKKCPALLRSFGQYVQHLGKAHTDSSSTCGDCGRGFKTSYGFRAHLSIHTLKVCPGCDKLFRNQTCYLYHVKRCCNLYSNKKEIQNTKTKMIEVKNRQSNKKVRVGMRGSTNKQCICDYCGKKFAGKKFVSAHIQIVHMKNTHRPCSYCGKLLAAAHMTEHVKKHELIRSYRCEHCSLVLKTKLGYVQHLRLHTGEKPYVCQYCGDSFSASSRRSQHILKIHKSSEIMFKHACLYCPARFRLPYIMKKHISSVHSMNLEDPQFECNECEEKFSSCRGLVHHSRIHQNTQL